MTTQFQDALSQSLSRGFRIAEQLSQTSVIMLKKSFIGREKWLFIWVDDHSNVQTSKQSFGDLTKKLSEKVRLQRGLETKMSYTDKRVAGKGYGELDLFSRLLVDEEEKNYQMLEQLKRERAIIENEIRFRNCLGNVIEFLKMEIERCLNVGYEVKSHTNGSAVLERRTPHLTGAETLNLCISPDDNVQRRGTSCKEMQERLDSLISTFNLYRTIKPTIGREKQVLDKQFELDAEINALQKEMKYLGYTPNLKGYIL